MTQNNQPYFDVEVKRYAKDGVDSEIYIIQAANRTLAKQIAKEIASSDAESQGAPFLVGERITAKVIGEA